MKFSKKKIGGWPPWVWVGSVKSEFMWKLSVLIRVSVASDSPGNGGQTHWAPSDLVGGAPALHNELDGNETVGDKKHDNPKFAPVLTPFTPKWRPVAPLPNIRSNAVFNSSSNSGGLWARPARPKTLSVSLSLPLLSLLKPLSSPLRTHPSTLSSYRDPEHPNHPIA